MAQIVLAFQLLTGATLTWTADRDYLFLGARSTSAAAGTQLITTDPSLVPGTVVIPVATRLITGDLLWANANTAQAANLPTKIPVPKGTVLLVSAATSATTVFVHLEDASTETELT
jgi:hypothetical protein